VLPFKTALIIVREAMNLLTIKELIQEEVIITKTKMILISILTTASFLQKIYNPNMFQRKRLVEMNGV